ncbi:Hypothetical predicted protein [Podarcis lilfordi]|uniref:SH3 domain-containing protein n=1 Tax=Podarcis lilfordi TaxID=74358 RepID=A0AA35LE30_9SAUR|nr:Hypothetical predicted protein [Podarcis lilfordi]
MGRHEARRLFWHAALLAASVLNSCILLAGAQGATGIRIRVDPEVLKEGDRVTLTPEGVDLEALRNCKWYRGAINSS